MAHTVTTQRTVVAAHDPGARNPFAAPAGEWLTCENRATEWAGWLWCTASSGAAAWVPEEWLQGEGSRRSLVHDYDARELAIRPGEQVSVLETTAQWALVVGGGGERGWVPLSCLGPR